MSALPLLGCLLNVAFSGRRLPFTRGQSVIPTSLIFCEDFNYKNRVSGVQAGRARRNIPQLPMFSMEDEAPCNWPFRPMIFRRGGKPGSPGEYPTVRFRAKKRAGIPPFAGVGPMHDAEPEERHAPELERQLLRHGVVRMSAGRCACSQCGRSPLVGERLQIFAGKHGAERALCDLCLAIAETAGAPLRMEQVRAGERPLAIIRAA